MVEYLDNDYLPWATFRALTWSRLGNPHEFLKVRPIGAGDIFCMLLCKILLSTTRKQATRTCWIDQLCGGLEAREEGSTCNTRSICNQNYDKEED